MATYSAEPMPTLVLKTVLDEQWLTYSNTIPKPRLIDINDGVTPLRHDLFTGDTILIQLGTPGEEETWRDSWYYVDRTNRVELQIFTKVSRQRLYDLKQEIRRIIHNQKHSLDDYQVLRYTGFTEYNREQFNMWGGNITCTLENNRIMMEQ